MPMMPFIGVRISWLTFAQERRLHVGRLDRLVARVAVGVVELDEALESLATLAGKQPDKAQEGQRRERGDGAR